MDTSKKAESAHLLDDLESIRKLLEEENLQPPLLTETVHREEQIPLLFDVVDSQPPSQAASVEALPPPTPDAPPAAAGAPPSVDTLLHLDADLRSAAQLIMQDVINDFAPHIENEIKRRLEARLERLIAAAGGKG
ncbi:DNA polymerase III subunit chi [Pseudomonas sp. DTU_2021_1001937_2_SI_NGA_ILE_001]|uniref:DNA polymerase III subunit chi n=1 Tax=Pseudomonas sp. DTU_2021_1001937_2_SI_NGA_ILE_001 TaxID=3077589 RepID=UPI0028FC11A6|nr:DNA polymerase III subunit chi [Pseudomonas sp. DTU_2021_1001937_2_SI_NGA_ILE_001]WNW13569.1 DNA polymerase III subunit chi [Pseudomonas sp. DTU_2021_1001937_2_SI_NGA_ILE_001]